MRKELVLTHRDTGLTDGGQQQPTYRLAFFDPDTNTYESNDVLFADLMNLLAQLGWGDPTHGKFPKLEIGMTP